MDTAITLTSSSVALTSIRFDSTDLERIREQLQKKQAEAPALFNGFPCAIDLHQLTPETFDLAAVLNACQEHGFLAIAVQNAADDWQPTLQRLQIADIGSLRTQHNDTINATDASAAPAVRTTRSYRGNVRSGQQISHDGDLIIFGMVSAGAEVLATGDLHVFGTLRGRALAGIKGNEQALITCQQFDPELVAIAGQYRLFEDQSQASHQAVAIQLCDGNLNINHVS